MPGTGERQEIAQRVNAQSSRNRSAIEVAAFEDHVALRQLRLEELSAQFQHHQKEILPERKLHHEAA
jgi:hypothetical protein